MSKFRRSALSATLSCFALLAGCSSAAPSVSAVPAPLQAAASSPSPPPPSPLAAPFDPVEPETSGLISLPPLPRALAGAAPAFCPRLGFPRERDATCADRDEALRRLAAVLAPDLERSPPGLVTCVTPWTPEISASELKGYGVDPGMRDGHLARLEACAGIDPALIRLTRAWYWPGCADALAEGALNGEHAMSGSLQVALNGYSIAAKLDRLRYDPPRNGTLRGNAAIEALRTRLSPWLNGEVAALREVERHVEALPHDSHGRAVAELALAATRFRLYMARPFPHLADKHKTEYRKVFYTAYEDVVRPLLDDGLNRAREEWRAASVVADWTLLRRWAPEWTEYFLAAALRELVLPPLPNPSKKPDRDGILALALPPFVATRLLSFDGADADVLWNLTVRGFEPRLRRWSAARNFAATESLILAHARLVLAVRTLDPSQGAEAVRLVAAHGKLEDTALLAAIGAGFSRLPQAVAWARNDAPRETSTVALDALATRAGASPAIRAMAAFDSMLFAALREPAHARYPLRFERDTEMIREVGPPLANCLSSGVFRGSILCECPGVGR